MMVYFMVDCVVPFSFEVFMAAKTNPAAATRPRPTPWRTTSTQRMVVSALLALAALAAGAAYWLPMSAQAGATGFPFDEAWVILSYARTLVEHGVYSVHAADAASSGSTAPLLVLLTAVPGMLFGVSADVAVLLGLLSFAAAAVLLFRLCLMVFADEQRIAIVVAALFVLSPLSPSAAVAGLATMPYVALLLASMLAYFSRKPLGFFIFAGLALWLRVDALVFFLAAVLHLLYHHGLVRRDEAAAAAPASRRDTVLGAVLYVLLLVGYVLFNLATGGSMLPHPVAANLAWYAGAESAFVADVWRFFISSMHAVLLLFAVYGVALLVPALLRRRPAPLLMAAAYMLGAILAYGLLFPFLRSMHTLYPLLPFFLMLAVWGLHSAWRSLSWLLAVPPIRVLLGIAAVLVLGGAVVMAVVDWAPMRAAHLRMVRDSNDRTVAAAQWIAANTPGDARIATHFPGAVGFFGQRSVVDMTGTVTPEVIPAIGNLNALVGELKRMKVTYIATQRDRFEVVNVSAGWRSDPNAPQVTEVFPYIERKTHIMSQRASGLNMQAAALISQRRFREAYQTLEQSFKEDPVSSRTNTLLGLSLLEMGDTARAVEFLQQALNFDPDYAPAMVPLGDVYAAQGNMWSALPLLQRAHEGNPLSARARMSYRNALKKHREDSLRARGIQTVTITR